ncbi:Na(+)/citrate cotransporter-like [Argiope bruennichi]|uniref:Na(+)/citrate cotransporter-like n=1 Tax=Argiope bruennichi TaxID=94029 RepID=UPI002494359A|nr:Na(+)/citrate cotransporter-like [Argiope bruennichi]
MKWKNFFYIVCLLLPFVLLPLALSSHKESQCAYVVIIVVSYWLLEPAHMYAVSILPVALFPLLGIISSTDVAKNYMKEGIMVVIGGMVAAIAVENCKLHERIALKILLLVGTEIKWLLLGFMLTTMLMSMWMTNTATTAMMIPIVDALVEEISSNTKEIYLDENNFETNNKLLCDTEMNGKTNNRTKDQNDKVAVLKKTLLLGVCYAANIGGTGTIIGTPSNVALVALLQTLYPGTNEITFASWMMYSIPGVLLCITFGWLYLWLINIYFSKLKQNDESKEEIYGIISKRYKRLGSISFHEASVMVLFGLLILLWIFRDPEFIPGWATVFFPKSKVGDSTVAVAIAFLMFFLPSNIRDLSSPPILEWKTAHAKFPWGVLFLIGAASSLAQGIQVSGLSDLLGSKLSALRVLSPGLIVTVTCFSTAMITEIISNFAATVILLPILSEIALTIGVNPLYLMLPCAIVCSYAFMLPISTVPNAFVFDSGNMKLMDMLKPGIVMNVACCCIQLFTLHTLGVALFDLNKFPSWAQHKGITNTMTINVTDFGSMPANTTQILNNTLIL